MIKTSIEKIAESIGFEIGASDDVTQSNLLNGFCKGISNSILDSNKLDLQLCFIVDKLDPNSHRVIKRLFQFIDLNENSSKPK